MRQMRVWWAAKENGGAFLHNTESQDNDQHRFALKLNVPRLQYLRYSVGYDRFDGS